MVSAGRDLRAIFALLRKDGSGRIAQRSALLLLRALTVMARHLGPTTFFDFANEGAGIMRNNPLRFPGALLLKEKETAPALHAHLSCLVCYQWAPGTLQPKPGVQGLTCACTLY